jgi:hypothetical protein
MTAEQAAQRLDDRLRGRHWYVSVGIGTTSAGEAIFVYVKSLRHRELTDLREGWMGYPVLVRAVGSIKAGTHRRQETAAL